MPRVCKKSFKAKFNVCFRTTRTLSETARLVFDHPSHKSDPAYINIQRISKALLSQMVEGPPSTIWLRYLYTTEKKQTVILILHKINTPIDHEVLNQGKEFRSAVPQ